MQRIQNDIKERKFYKKRSKSEVKIKKDQTPQKVGRKRQTNHGTAKTFADAVWCHLLQPWGLLPLTNVSTAVAFSPSQPLMYWALYSIRSRCPVNAANNKPYSNAHKVRSKRGGGLHSMHTQHPFPHPHVPAFDPPCLPPKPPHQYRSLHVPL